MAVRDDIFWVSAVRDQRFFWGPAGMTGFLLGSPGIDWYVAEAFEMTHQESLIPAVEMTWFVIMTVGDGK